MKKDAWKSILSFWDPVTLKTGELLNFSVSVCLFTFHVSYLRRFTDATPTNGYPVAMWEITSKDHQIPILPVQLKNHVVFSASLSNLN